MPTFHFELASPERLVFSGAVDQVDVPGAEGDFGVLSAHAPLVTVLRPGLLTVTAGTEKQQYVVLGGFAEVGTSGLTILADMAISLADLDRAWLESQIREQEEKIKEMEQGTALDRAIARLDHFKALSTHMTGTAMH